MDFPSSLGLKMERKQKRMRTDEEQENKKKHRTAKDDDLFETISEELVVHDEKIQQGDNILSKTNKELRDEMVRREVDDLLEEEEEPERRYFPRIPSWNTPDKEGVGKRISKFLVWYRKSKHTLSSPSAEYRKVMKDMSRRTRRKLNLRASDNMVIGPFTYRLYNELVDCNSEFRGSALKNRRRYGRFVPPDLTYVSDMHNERAEFVLVVQDVSVYYELTEINFHNDYNCIIMTGKKMQHLALRQFANFITEEFEIPAFLLSDPDLRGVETYALFKYGSANKAFHSDSLAIPLIYWLGIWPSELDALNIPSKKLSLQEESEAMQFLKKEFVTSDKRLENETCYMLVRKKKAFICTLSYYGLDGTSDYLVYKLCKAMGDIMEGRFHK